MRHWSPFKICWKLVRKTIVITRFYINAFAEYFIYVGPYVGLALVPYYIQILPILNIIRCTLLEENLRDKIFFKANDLAQMIDRTVELMERLGGPDAFMNIKYVMRTYESCILNWQCVTWSLLLLEKLENRAICFSYLFQYLFFRIKTKITFHFFAEW